MGTHKKVLLAAPYGESNGGIATWTKHVVNYYNNLITPDVEMEILPMGRVDYMTFQRKYLKRIYLGIRDYSRFIRMEYKLLKTGEYSVFHVVSSATLSLLKDYVMISIAKHFGVKSIVHFRHGTLPSIAKANTLQWKFMKIVSRKADCVCVLNKKSFDAFNNTGIKRVVLIPNPIAPRVIEQIKNNGVVERKKNEILFVGQCYKEKGIFELAEACKEIPNVRLKYIGSVRPDAEPELKAYNKRREWIEILGNRSYDCVIHAMQECSVFVLPSYSEGFPNVILESMACGCPVVATDVGSIPEMLDCEQNNGKYGICIKPKEVGVLKDAINKFLQDPAYAQECGENARKRVSELYSMPKVWTLLSDMWMTV